MINQGKSVCYQSIVRPLTPNNNNELNYATNSFSTAYSKASSSEVKENTTNQAEKETFNVLNIADKLLSQTNIYVVQSDKGGCSVLWKFEDYETEAFRHLDDESQYRCLNVLDKSSESSSSFSIVEKREKVISKYTSTITGKHHLGNSDHISRKSTFSLFNEEHLIERITRERDNLIGKLYSSGFLLIDEIIAMKSVIGKIPYVFLRPKVHKIPRSSDDRMLGRPVVTACSGPLFLLDKYLSRLTAPVLILTAGSLSNTQEIVTYLTSIVQSGQARCSTNHDISSKWMGFATADVVSLYPSIPIEQGILASVEVYTLHYWRLCKRAEEEQIYRPMDPPLFEIALRLVVENSYINFQNRFYYHQIKGAAMGSCISAYFANSYMFLLTRSVIERPPGWLRCFQRYVDDFFIFCCFHPSHGHDHLQKLFQSISNSNITFEINCGQNDKRNYAKISHCLPYAFERKLNDNNSNREMIENIIPNTEASKQWKEKIEFEVSESNKLDILNIPRNCCFLDVQFEFDCVKNQLDFRPLFNHYMSPMFLHRSSHHSPQLFKNIQYSQLVRMQNLSSSRKIFLQSVKPFKKFLIARGYGKGEIRRSVQRVEKNKSFLYEYRQNFPTCKKWIETENNNKDNTINMDEIRSYVQHVSRQPRCFRHHPYSGKTSDLNYLFLSLSILFIFIFRRQQFVRSIPQENQNRKALIVKQQKKFVYVEK